MNDFTKEELEIIHLNMTICAEKTKLLKESPSHKALRDKIQHMIDNYCTHDPRETRGAIGMYHCPDCGEMQIAGFPHVRINPYE